MWFHLLPYAHSDSGSEHQRTYSRADEAADRITDRVSNPRSNRRPDRGANVISAHPSSDALPDAGSNDIGTDKRPDPDPNLGPDPRNLSAQLGPRVLARRVQLCQRHWLAAHVELCRRCHVGVHTRQRPHPDGQLPGVHWQLADPGVSHNLLELRRT